LISNVIISTVIYIASLTGVIIFLLLAYCGVDCTIDSR